MIIWIIVQKPQSKRNLLETKQIIEDSCWAVWIIESKYIILIIFTLRSFNIVRRSIVPTSCGFIERTV